MKVSIRLASLPQHDTDEILDSCRALDVSYLMTKHGIQDSIEVEYRRMGQADGAIIVFPTNYFIEEVTYLWLMK